MSRNTCLSRIVMVKYGIWRPGKPAFRDAGLESRNARLSRPVISYAQYQMAPLVRTQCSSSFVQLIVRIALDAPYPTPTSHVSVHRSARQSSVPVSRPWGGLVSAGEPVSALPSTNPVLPGCHGATSPLNNLHWTETGQKENNISNNAKRRSCPMACRSLDSSLLLIRNTVLFTC